MKNLQTAETNFPGLRGAAIFYALAFAVSWTIWGTLIIFPQTADWAPLIIIFGAYGPLVAALILSRREAEPGGARRWFRSVSHIRGQWRWILLGALFLPLLIAVTHLVIYRLQIDPFTLSSNPPWYWAVSTAPLNILVLFWMSSAIEEYGWQGLAMPRLAARMHPLLACLLHGIIWGTWHLPLYYTGAWKGEYQALWLLYGITIALSPTLFWLTQKAAGSVIPAVLFHAGTNYYSSVFVESQDFPIFVEPLSASFEEIKAVIYLVLALILIIATRGRLGFVERSSPAHEIRAEAPS